MLANVPGVYSTVDFGPTESANKSFANQRMFEPDGPLVNSEFYTGWDDTWGSPHHNTPSKVITPALDTLLAMGANVNHYMGHGGSNFGLTTGANWIDNKFKPYTSTYDYSAPISEAGDLTQKYFDIKRIIAKYLPIPSIEVNATQPKGDYGKVMMSPRQSVFIGGKKRQGYRKFITQVVKSKYPKSFEQLGQGPGFVTYKTTVHKRFRDPAKLTLSGIRDRG